jgi:hypothetical protein
MPVSPHGQSIIGCKRPILPAAVFVVYIRVRIS